MGEASEPVEHSSAMGLAGVAGDQVDFEVVAGNVGDHSTKGIVDNGGDAATAPVVVKYAQAKTGNWFLGSTCH